MDNEQWKPVPYEGFDKHYEISNLGRVRRISTGRIISQRAMSNRNYLMASLHYVNSKGKGEYRSISIARTVALNFVPNDSPLTKTLASYKDGDPSNVHYKNLKWISFSEMRTQEHHKHIKKVRDNKKPLRRMKRKQYKKHLSKSQIEQMKKLFELGFSEAFIVSKFGITQGATRYHLFKQRT